MSIHSSVTNGVARIAISRPEKKNALTAAMYQQLAEAIAAAEADHAVRCLLICGTPDAFTAGNDLEEFARHPPNSADAPVFRFMAALRDAEKPVVAAVTGVAVGIGTTLLLHCDLVYAADTARFSMPFVSLGLCSEFASSFLLPLRAGHSRAAEKLLLAEPFDAADALELRIVTRVLPAAEVLTYAQTRAERFSALPPNSVRTTKRLMKHAHRRVVEEVMAMEIEHFAQLLRSGEAKEAFAAFFERRPADFSRF